MTKYLIVKEGSTTEPGPVLSDFAQAVVAAPDAETARGTLGVGSAGEQDESAFATAAQGVLAASAIQPADLVTVTQAEAEAGSETERRAWTALRVKQAIVAWITANLAVAWAQRFTALSGKATPVDADELGLVDSADSGNPKKLTWANIKATLKAYFDALYVAQADLATVSQAEAEAGVATTRRAWTSERVKQAIVAWITANLATAWAQRFTALAGKATLADADELGVVDSAASGAPKKVTWSNLKASVAAQMTDVFATSARVTTIEAETDLLTAGQRDIERSLGRDGSNQHENADFKLATVGLLTLPDPFNSYEEPAGLPSWSIWTNGGVGVSLPSEVEVVGGQWVEYSRTDRILRVRMERGNLGAETTDFQMRQIVTIPFELRGTEIQVRLTFTYKTNSSPQNVQVTSTGLLWGTDAAMSGGGYIAATQESVHVDQEWSVAVFTATINEPTATHIVFGPRLRTNGDGEGPGGATSDVDENALMGPCFVDFNRPEQRGYEANTDEAKALVAADIAAGQVAISAEAARAQSAEDKLDRNKRNMLPHADFSDGTLGTIITPGVTPNGGSLAGLPGWVGSYTVSASLGFPSTDLVDGFWWPRSQRDRAVAATMVRSNSGVDTTDLQLRQVFEIPEALREVSDLEVTFLYDYLINNEGIAVFSTGIWVADNAAMTGATYAAVSRDNDRVIGEKATAIFKVTVDTTGMTHMRFGPRLRVNLPGGGEGGGTSDINELAWVGPCAVYFEQSERTAWSPSEEDDNRAEAIRVQSEFSDRISRPATTIGNVILNGALFEVTPDVALPPGWATTSGGSGSKAADWRVVDLPGLPTHIPARGFEIDHEYDGTNHTDRQFQQVLALPPELYDTDATVSFVQYVKLDANVSHELVVIPEDLDGNLVGALTYPDEVVEPIGNGWLKVSYVMAIGDGVEQLDTRFRTRADTGAGVTSGLKAYQTLFSAAFNVPSYVTDYEPNREDDTDRRARNQIASDRLALGTPTRHDVYVDVQGNVLPMVPEQDLLVLGDSQTDSYEDEVLAEFPTRGVAEGGIGGEWVSTHILNRMRGHSIGALPTFSGAGTYRIRTDRAVPPRCISESYRASWETYGLKIAEPEFVEFYNADGLIGRSYTQETAEATVSGATLTDADGHPFSNGGQVYVLQESVPGNMYRGKVYYVRDVSGNSFSLAEFDGGAAISFDAFGGSITVLGGFYLDWAWNGSDDTTVTAKTFTDWSKKTLILNGGTNDIGQGVTADAICAAYDLIAAEQKTLAKRIIFETIPGFWNADGDWEIGGDYHDVMVSVHDYIKRRYPTMVADTYSELLLSGDGSADDNADIALGLVPRSLRNASTDGHLNSSGNEIRARVIASVVRGLKW